MTALIYNQVKACTGMLQGHTLATPRATPDYGPAREFHHFFKGKCCSLKRTAKRRKDLVFEDMNEMNIRKY